MHPIKTSYAITIVLLAGLFTFVASGVGPAQAQRVVSTAYIGDDLGGLLDAVGREPRNIGLRMRVVRKMLEDVRTTADVRRSSTLLKRVEEQMTAIKNLGPDFPYVYQVLARLHYGRRQNTELLAILDDLSKVSELDYQMRTLYVKALLRMAVGDEEGGKARKHQAAEYVGNWFDSELAPTFGATLGACAAWLIDEDFRDELLSIFSARYQKDSANLNLVISYAACLSALGRNESAWKLVQDAEKIGLCDTSSGDRHPVAHLLEMHCPEFGGTESYRGMDIEELTALAEKYPANASFKLRLAIILKRRAAAAERLARFCDLKVAEATNSGNTAERDRFSTKRVEIRAKGREYYERALPEALAAQKLNPRVETIALILGDIYYKLERYDDAIANFEAGVKRLPFYTDLHEGLALVHTARKDWKAAAREMVEVCKVAPPQVKDWDTAAPDSLLPVPAAPREKLLVQLIEDRASRDVVLQTFEEAARSEEKNPNLKTFLAMLYYFAGDRDKAAFWMIEAERQGMCGEAGFEHELATYIYTR